MTFKPVGVDENSNFPTRVMNKLKTIFADKTVETSKLDKTEAATTYVKFVDLSGNPITARHVTIKVDTSTWDVADIVVEA